MPIKFRTRGGGSVSHIFSLCESKISISEQFTGEAPAVLTFPFDRNSVARRVPIPAVAPP